MDFGYDLCTCMNCPAAKVVPQMLSK
uniref:Uncharacterized protein n=1 Tax=Anguilla anguilla TaxID=7936 RepID=A0A0E9U6Q1_ANGAN